MRKMKLYIEGQTLDLTQMTRKEILALKSSLERERRKIRDQLQGPLGYRDPEWARNAKEAFQIKDSRFIE